MTGHQDMTLLARRLYSQNESNPQVTNIYIYNIYNNTAYYFIH